MKTRSSFQKASYSFNTGTRKILLIAVGCLLLTQAKSQTDKRLVMADQYFAAGDYFTAAGLYGQFLNPEKKAKYHSDFPLNTVRNSEKKSGSYRSKTDILFRQAESYRLANYWSEAANLYKQCFEEDSSKYASSLYWLAVCQRSLGAYTNAEENLNRYFANNSQDHEYDTAALKEKQILQFIKKQLSRPDVASYNVQKINSAFADKGIFAPAALNEQQYLFTSTHSDAVSASSNPHYNRLFNSLLTKDGLQNVEPVIIEAIDSSLNQGAASISSDGKHLYFTQWKKENGLSLSAIYFSNKINSGWSKPQLLKSVNEHGHSSKQPFCSADGKYLYFASDRTGGLGGFDIWYARLLEDGTTGEVANAGVIINSIANEQSPFYHSGSATLVFASDRLPTMGGYDLFTSKGNIAGWKIPENMGYPVNSSRDDVYFFATENDNLLNNAIVSSDRGSECCLSTYAVTKRSKEKIITGVVLDCATHKPLANAQVSFRGASGKTFEAKTSFDGKYSFDLADKASQHQMVVNREKYSDKTTDVVIESINESNWQVDTFHNAAICLEKKFVLNVANVVTIFFDFDKSQIKQRGSEQLDSIYNAMVQNPSYSLQISGYTDGKGSIEYNRKLSDRRAKSCADYLIRKGLDPARILFESFGSCCPIEMELINGRDNAEGRSKNRRALININKPEED